MTVTVQLNDYFSRYGAQSGKVSLPDGATVADLLSYLKLPPSEVGFVIKDGQVLKETDKLNDGDNLLILPFAMGG